MDGMKMTQMGSHIVDWMPNGDESDQTVALHEFTASNYMSVTNMFGARGLEQMAEVLAVAGTRPENVSKFAAEGAALRASIVKEMWNGTAFCDGVCADVQGASLVMTNMFGLAFGFPQTQGQPAVDLAWTVTADWGIENIGDYGAFWLQHALGGGYYSGRPYDTPTTDDGSAMVAQLAKCDRDSWCSGLLQDNLTMTRESWHDGTYSHEWGTSAIVGVAWGIMGTCRRSKWGEEKETHRVDARTVGWGWDGPGEPANTTYPTLRCVLSCVSDPLRRAFSTCAALAGWSDFVPLTLTPPPPTNTTCSHHTRRRAARATWAFFASAPKLPST